MAKDSLTRFANILYNEALNEKEKTVKYLQQERKDILARKDEEIEKKFNYETGKIKARLEYELRLSLSRRETELTKALMENRQRVSAEIFEAAEHRLTEFTRSPGYKAFLQKELSSVEGEFKNGAAVCKARECDVELIRSLCTLKNVEFEAESSDIIGGFTLRSTELGIYADCTLRGKLEEQKSEFFGISGLSID